MPSMKESIEKGQVITYNGKATLPMASPSRHRAT